MPLSSVVAASSRLIEMVFPNQFESGAGRRCPVIDVAMICAAKSVVSALQRCSYAEVSRCAQSARVQRPRGVSPG